MFENAIGAANTTPMLFGGQTNNGIAGARDTTKTSMFDELFRMYQQGALATDLAVWVRRCFEDAKRHKIQSGVEQDIMRCMRAVNLQYDPEDQALLEPGVDIYMGLTAMKVRALKSWLSDILTNAEDRPWTLKASPVPELPPEAEEAVIDALIREMQMYGFDVDLRERAAQLKDVAQKQADKIAAEATARMELKIADTMLEGGWRDTFRHFLTDVASLPTAWLKGPITERTPSLRWKGGRLAVVDRVRLTVKRIHPLDVFPSPNSTTPQDGSYVIERMRWTVDDMNQATTLPGFEEAAIRRILVDHPAGVRELVNTDSERAILEHVDQRQVGTTDNRYDVLAYYGKISGRLLMEHRVPGVNNPQRVYEAEVWICNSTVIKAVLNPHPLGTRPFYCSSFEPVPGQVWGRGLPTILRDVQRVCNASARALVRNMAFASGPIGEYDVDRMAHETNIDQVRPWRLYAVQTDPLVQSSQPAIRFQKVDSNADQLLKVFEYYSKYADDISGIPAYVVGDPQTSGAGRTMGGLSMLMAHAAKGVKHLIANIDVGVIEQVVTNYYQLMMLFDPDRSIKSDVAVIARGSSGILQREISQARATEVLQVLTPYNDRGLVPGEGIQRVIIQMLNGLGFDQDSIVPDPDRQAQLARLAQQYGVEQANPALQGGAKSLHTMPATMNGGPSVKEQLPAVV